MTERIAKKWESTAPGAARDSRRVSKVLLRAIEHARELARGLSPPTAGVERGLMAALQDLAQRTQRLFRRKCSFHCTAPATTADRPVCVQDPAVCIHLYRIAQEAVSNAIRHGKASRIEIQLTARDNDLILAVRDNGCGISDVPRKIWGMGLHIMQYRAAVINGTLLLEPLAAGGTAVLCTVKDALAARAASDRS